MTHNPFQFAILRGLQSHPIYQGSVPKAVIAKRRKKNKAAGIARRLNRG